MILLLILLAKTIAQQCDLALTFGVFPNCQPRTACPEHAQDINIFDPTLDSICECVEGYYLGTAEVVPTTEPSEQPTEAPTERPTGAPTEGPTEYPTDAPTELQTDEPTEQPTEQPSFQPTFEPTEAPTEFPTTEEPTASPTIEPTFPPSFEPTAKPSFNPTEEDSDAPTVEPTLEPTDDENRRRLQGGLPQLQTCYLKTPCGANTNLANPRDPFGDNDCQCKGGFQGDPFKGCNPIESALFRIIHGSCTLDGANCVKSVNFGEGYPNDDNCSFVPTQTGKLIKDTWNVEAGCYDTLSIDGTKKCNGDFNNVAVPGNTLLTWSSDGSVTDLGWRICLQEVCPPGTYTDSENKCVPKRECPRNSRPMEQQDDGLDTQCECRPDYYGTTGFNVMGDNDCVPRTDCPANTILSDDVLANLGNDNFCFCAPGYFGPSGLAGEITPCVPRTDCPDGSFISNPDDTENNNLCECNPGTWGAKTTGDRIYCHPKSGCGENSFDMSTSTTNSVCQCNTGFAKNNQGLCAPSTNECQFTVSGDYCVKNGNCFETPGSKYANNKQCTITITKVKGNCVLERRKFDLEHHSSCNFDYLEFQAKNGAKTRMCGGAFTMSGQEVQVGDKFKFASDSSVTRDGFKICMKE